MSEPSDEHGAGAPHDGRRDEPGDEPRDGSPEPRRDPADVTSADQGWYWDLERQTVVRADQRGRADSLLGPYPTPEAARNWRQQVETRNEAWDAADEEWYEGE